MPQRTYNLYREPDIETVENAIQAAEEHEGTETIGEALVVLARSYTGWDAREADEDAEEDVHEREAPAPPTSATDGGRPISDGSRPASSASMATCRNCGSPVSPQYVKTFAADEGEGVRCCPQCPDRVRTPTGIRDARSTRRNHGEGAVDHSRGEGTRG